VPKRRAEPGPVRNLGSGSDWRAAVLPLGRAAAVVVALLAPGPAPAAEGDVARGAYLVKAGGCTSCHSAKDGEPFAGGRALKTPFGTYYSPNITPDKATGIGGWSDADFLAALQQGVAPDGSHYFPVFPYTTYTRMREEDALAIKAYLFSLAPVGRANRAHDVAMPFNWRWTMGPWKWLFFEPGRFRPDPDADEAVNRGAYLVEALAHCGECHTPRNAAGAVDAAMWLAGTREGPEGEIAPNITPHETGIGGWSEADIVGLLRDGLTPEFDDVQGAMAEAIEDGLKDLTEDDLRAIARYLKTVPPVANDVGG
jgi:mono/diheme cytochrome c family protein